MPGYGGAIWELTSRALTVAIMKVANGLAPHQNPTNHQTTVRQLPASRMIIKAAGMMAYSMKKYIFQNVQRTQIVKLSFRFVYAS